MTPPQIKFLKSLRDEGSNNRGKETEKRKRVAHENVVFI